MSRNKTYQFIETDAGAIRRGMTARLEELTGQETRDGSPEALMLSWAAMIVAQERVLTNYAANQNLPSRAEGENLDALGELFLDQARPKATAAVCTVRFTISEPQDFSVFIPKGTRVTDAGGALVWETVKELEVRTGARFVDGAVRCQTAGIVGNGYVPGQIDTVVDLYDYCAGAANRTTSEGGADRADDETYYRLLRESMAGRSAAGTRGAYSRAAKGVSTEIADVVVAVPAACQVVLYVLMADGRPAGEEMKAAVLAAVQDDRVRILTDQVRVEDPEEVPYRVDLTYYMEEGAGMSREETDRAVSAAVAEYAAWQSGKMGRDINPSRLVGLLMQSGVKRVELTEPSFRKLEDGLGGGAPQMAKQEAVKLVNGGYERE